MEAKVQEAFSISLDSNPTTGYSWEADFDPDFIKLREKSFERGSSGAIGAGGSEKFTFLPLKAGETAIRMSYKRPWESKTAEERSFKIIIGM